MFCLLTVCSRLQAQEPATNATQWLEFRQSFIPSPSDLQTIQLKRKQATQIYLAKTANDSPALVAAAADNHLILAETKHGVGDFGGAREHLERAKSLLDPSMSSSKVVLPFVENNLKALDARAATEAGN